MKQFFDWLARYFAATGSPMTSVQVAEAFRGNFERSFKPALAKHGWPMPQTDEGKSVCMDLMCNPFIKW
jgi:hypothetical protein